MDFFNKIGGSIQNVGKEVSKKTKDLSGVVTLTAKVKESENNLEKVYKIIGEKYYMAYTQEASERFAEETQQISELKEKIEKDKEEIRKLKGLSICPNCNAEVESTVIHCPMCGTVVHTKEEILQEEEVQESESAFCPNCGLAVAKGAKFCGSCGNKIVS